MSKRFLLLLAVVATALLAEFTWQDDRWFWPNSAHGRIEEMASVLRSIEGPARWCNASENTLNLLNQRNSDQRDQLSRCMSKIVPVSDFEEIHENYYIRRFYRAFVDDKVCEVTLSTVWRNDRIVGSDCYFGIFERLDDTGIGLTADPFG